MGASEDCLIFNSPENTAYAGATPEVAVALIGACLGKANVPEPLRLAHMIARAIAVGESRGRV